MENALQVFTNEQFGTVRTFLKDGEVCFIAADCCAALEIKNVSQALENFDEDEKGISIVYTLGGEQKMLYVTEAGLYRLIFMSRKHNAKVFQRWIFHEVIPAIRKTGAYSLFENKVMPKCVPVTLEEIKVFTSELGSLSSEARRVAKRLIKISTKFEEMMNLATQDLPGEIWYDIIGYEGIYQISNKKRVKSFHFGRVRIIKQTVDKDGYHRVQLSKNGENHICGVHRLLAEAVIPNLQNLPVVHHRDDNRSNNSIDNLEWATKSDNAKYAVAAGKVKLGIERFNAKLTDDAVRYILANYIPYHHEFGATALARKFGVSVSAICNVIHRRTWKHVDAVAEVQ